MGAAMKAKKAHPLKTRPFPAAKLIGLRLLEVGEGAAVCEMRTKLHHQNPVGRVHGGILCDLADAAMGYAFLSYLPPSQKGVAIHFQISFLRPVRAGQYLVATAITASHGRSLYFMECTIKDVSGKAVAKATSTCKVLPKGKN